MTFVFFAVCCLGLEEDFVFDFGTVAVLDVVVGFFCDTARKDILAPAPSVENVSSSLSDTLNNCTCSFPPFCPTKEVASVRRVAV
jgi:hypothetical protein